MSLTNARRDSAQLLGDAEEIVVDGESSLISILPPGFQFGGQLAYAKQTRSYVFVTTKRFIWIPRHGMLLPPLRRLPPSWVEFGEITQAEMRDRGLALRSNERTVPISLIQESSMTPWPVWGLNHPRPTRLEAQREWQTLATGRLTGTTVSDLRSVVGRTRSSFLESQTRNASIAAAIVLGGAFLLMLAIAIVVLAT